MPWTDVAIRPRELSRHGSQLTMQSEHMHGVIYTDTANVKNDIGAIKWLGPQRIDMGDRRALLELKAMTGLKVSYVYFSCRNEQFTTRNRIIYHFLGHLFLA